MPTRTCARASSSRSSAHVPSSAAAYQRVLAVDPSTGSLRIDDAAAAFDLDVEQLMAWARRFVVDLDPDEELSDAVVVRIAIAALVGVCLERERAAQPA